MNKRTAKRSSRGEAVVTGRAPHTRREHARRERDRDVEQDRVQQDVIRHGDARAKAIQEAYFKVVRGQDSEYDYWLERV